MTDVGHIIYSAHVLDAPPTSSDLKWAHKVLERYAEHHSVELADPVRDHLAEEEYKGQQKCDHALVLSARVIKLVDGG